MSTAVSRLSRFHLGIPVLALTAAMVLVNALTIKHPWRLDLTSTGVYSINTATRRVIDAVQKPVRITFFYDLRSKAMQDSLFLLQQYANASPLITVKAIDPQLQPAQARRYKVQFAGTSVFESGNRRVRINGGAEVDFTNGLIRVSTQAGQLVCFTAGHLENDPFSLKTHDHFEGDMKSAHNHSTGGRILELHERHGMGMARDALEIMGYRVRKVVLIQGPDQLQDCSILVIASPQRKFQPREIVQFREFLLAGGKSIVMLEPFFTSGLEPVLAEYGIGLEPGIVIDDERHYWTDSATPAVSNYPRHALTRRLALSFFPGSVSLIPVPADYRSIKITPLLRTSGQSWVQPLQAGRPVPLNKGSRILMVQALKTTQQTTGAAAPGGPSSGSHLIVIGDGDFATNSYFHILGNGTLFLNAINVLAGEERLVDIQPRHYVMPSIRLSNRQMALTFFTSTVLLPLLLLLTGGYICWWRRARP